MSRESLLIVSRAPQDVSGFGKVVRHLSKLPYNTYCLALNYFTQPIEYLGMKVLPNNPTDPSGRRAYEAIYPKIKPDVVIFVEDVARIVFRDIITYTPIDGEWLHPILKQLLDQNFSVVPSEFGKKVYPRATVIPHAVDLSIFKPKNVSELRKKLNLEDKFIVGCVARNTFRKRFDTLLFAIAKIKKYIPNLLLLLHTDPKEQDRFAFDIFDIVNRLGLQKHVMISPFQLSFFHGCSDETLSNFYNLLDVYVCPSSREGFGIPIIEAMACGVPAIGTNYASFPEIINDPDLLIDVKGYFAEGPNSFLNALPDETDLAAKLFNLATNEDLLRRKKKEALAKVNKYSLNNFLDAWKKYLNSVPCETL